MHEELEMIVVVMGRRRRRDESCENPFWQKNVVGTFVDDGRSE